MKLFNWKFWKSKADRRDQEFWDRLMLMINPTVDEPDPPREQVREHLRQWGRGLRIKARKAREAATTAVADREAVQYTDTSAEVWTADDPRVADLQRRWNETHPETHAVWCLVQEINPCEVTTVNWAYFAEGLEHSVRIRTPEQILDDAIVRAEEDAFLNGVVGCSDQYITQTRNR